jgi:hypothetical protein
VTTLYLVSCVGKKQPREAGVDGLTKLYPASDLYLSDWFLKAKAYVTQPRDLAFDHSPGRHCWGVLSARFGFLEPTDWIAPYNETLKGKTKEERATWSVNVIRQIRKFNELRGQVTSIIIFAGQSYRHPLTGFLMELFDFEEGRVFAPLARYGIGEQLSWFKRNTRKECDE